MPKTRGGRGRTARMLAICEISLRGGSHQGQKRRLLEKLEGSAEISDLQDENVLTSPKSPRLLKPFSTYTVNAKGIFESTLMSPVPLKDLPVLNDTARNISESSCELPVVVTSFSQGSKIINNTAMQSDVQENSVEIHLEKTDDLIQPEIPEILPVGEMIESTKKGNIFEFECELPVAISSSILQEVPVIIDSEVQENSVELHLEKTDDLIQLETETVIISKIPDIFPVDETIESEIERDLPVALSSGVLQVPKLIEGEVQENFVELHIENADDLIQLEPEPIIISKIPEILPLASAVSSENLQNQISQDRCDDEVEAREIVGDSDNIPDDMNNSEASSTEITRTSEEETSANIKPFSSKNVQEGKTNKNMGRKYKTAKGKVKETRKMKPLRQNCRNKCREKLTETERQKIFDEYWSLGTHDRRVAFIASLITTKETKITRAKVDGRPIKNRLNTFIYNFEINGEKVQICKICFLATLDETEKFITCTMVNKMSSSSGITHTDYRGKHTPIHKTEQKIIDEVVKHIQSFPAYESHYSRRHTNKKYLASNLNLNTMYNLYREKHKRKPVSIKIYAREFHKLGLKFKKPKNDTCTKCDTLLAKEKFCDNEEEKQKIIQERKLHLADADAAYEAKDADKKRGFEDPTHVTFAFDLQQVLQTPYLSCNKMFYLRQLATYNLTIHNCSSGDSVHYMWPECTASRGANEISSCLFRHIIHNIPNGVKTAVFYSDTCGGQNKNSIVCAMFQFAIHQHPTLETIDHKFLIPGHTHLECDVDHSVIERAKKKCGFDIHIPRDWYQLVRIASKKNKFKVEIMEQEHFFTFSELSSKGPLRAKDKSFKLREIRWIQYTKESTTIKFKSTIEEKELFKEINFVKKGQKLSNLKKYTLAQLYTSKRPISAKKKENLLEIVSLLDKDVREYYHNLPSDKKIEKDTDPDLDRYNSEDDE